MTNTQSRATASLIGLAVGDALGAPVEFKEPGEFGPVTDYAYSPVWNIPAGYWTDDTSMAICLAESVLARDTVDPLDLITRFGRWYQRGENSSTGRCFDIGITTQENICRFLETGEYAPAPNEPRQSGNGSIMRLAPVAIRWWSHPHMAQVMAVAQGQVTHGSDECRQCCEELALILVRGMEEQGVREELQTFAQLVNPQEISNSGRASTTLVAAKWCVGTTTTFEEAVVKAVNLGGDSDTIGAVTGQIAGSIYGMEGIPSRWRDRLHKGARLEQLAKDLFWGINR